jgi:hypothetical protein
VRCCSPGTVTLGKELLHSVEDGLGDERLMPAGIDEAF